MHSLSKARATPQAMVLCTRRDPLRNQRSYVLSMYVCVTTWILRKGAWSSHQGQIGISHDPFTAETTFPHTACAVIYLRAQSLSEVCVCRAAPNILPKILLSWRLTLRASFDQSGGGRSSREGGKTASVTASRVQLT